jgi:uncharacterized protein GlcG (DUF336 family)
MAMEEFRFSAADFARARYGKRASPIRLLPVCVAFFVADSCGCDSEKSPTVANPIGSQILEVQDVQTLITQAVEQAERLNEKIVVAVTDREANILGVFRMTGSTGSMEDPVLGAVAKARTAAYLSSNQHGFTTLTACFITRKHFPPGVNNTPAGPLFGVPFSSLGGGDIQTNGGAVSGVPGNGQPGLTGVPGGVPIFKNRLLAGAWGLAVARLLSNCSKICLIVAPLSSTMKSLPSGRCWVTRCRRRSAATIFFWMAFGCSMPTPKLHGAISHFPLRTSPAAAPWIQDFPFGQRRRPNFLAKGRSISMPATILEF